MLRLETETGWWLVTHPDHARLAGAVAEHWGNDLFAAPEPRKHVLLGVNTHDDGWAMRDASPSVTKQGKPAAFSVELVGKYSAFEEIDLQDYLNVRERAVAEIAAKDAYAALLVSKHTYNLLTARADRSTIAPEQLPLLDAFLQRQRELQAGLFAAIRSDAKFHEEDVTDEKIEEHFRLLQATDNMSLLACVDYGADATLLHPLKLRDGGTAEVAVTPLGGRSFKLEPYPLRQDRVVIEFPARHVEGKTFASSEELGRAFHDAKVETLTLTLSA
jgi:hypothetical protein